MNKELTLEEAENIVDNMYQNRWKECGVEEGNTIHLGNLSNLKYNELESASILLLRTEIGLKREIKKLQQEKQELENQQKEFIEYMSKTIEELETDDVGDEELKGYLIQEIDIFKEILSKYYEIIEK